MFRTLKSWLSSPWVTTRPWRDHRRRSLRPALEALEERHLLTAFPVVNSRVNEDFLLYQNGSLKEIDHNRTILNTTTIERSVRANSLSVGTDANGRGMAAYIRESDGLAYEWDDTTHQSLGLVSNALGVSNNVKSVAAGQGGIVFVLTTGNHLWKVDTAHQQWTDVGDNVASVSASAGRIESFDIDLFVLTLHTIKTTMVDILKTDGTAWEWSEWRTTSGDPLPPSILPNPLSPLANSSLGITNNVKSVSRAATGESFVLLTSGELFKFDPSSHAWSDLRGSIASVSAGTDSAGNAMATVKDLNGVLWDWSTTHPWDAAHGFFQQVVYPNIPPTPLRPRNPFGAPSGIGARPVPLPAPATVVSFNAGANGVVDVVLSDGSLYQCSDATHRWSLVDTGVA